jgi:hypothetical protein
MPTLDCYTPKSIMLPDRPLVCRSVPVIVIGIVKSIFRAKKQAHDRKDGGQDEQYSFDIHWFTPGVRFDVQVDQSPIQNSMTSR